MIRLDNILRKIVDIETHTLRKPTHVALSQKNAEDLISQYGEIVKSDADSIYQYDEDYTIEDVGDFLGISILIYTRNINDFKILEEVTTDS